MAGTTLLGSLFCFLSVLSFQPAHAQATLSNSAQDTTVKATDSAIKFPSAILVQLNSEHNRIEALAKARRRNEMEMEIVKTDAARIIERTIADFKDHLKSCPVYFYVDTNIELVKSRKFNGILVNADSTLVTNPVITDTSRDYLVVYYGYPAYQPKASDSVDNASDYTYGSGEPFGRGLIIDNYQFQQVSYLYKLGYDNLLFRLSRANRKYIYTSKRFDMEYFPFAPRLETRLEQLAKKIRINHYRGGDLSGKLTK